MNPASFNPIIKRRNFLKLLAAGGATAVGIHLLDSYAPWLKDDMERLQNPETFDEETSMTDPIKKIILYATMAASGHNTQPWKFAVQQNAIQIHPDYSRRLAVVDPHDRELWVSLGCALENLIIAARSAGYAAETVYPTTQDFIPLTLSADTPQTSPLFNAIPLRQNTRSVYDAQPLGGEILAQLQALSLEPGITLHWFTQPSEMDALAKAIYQGNLDQFGDKAFVGELIHWLRFNKKDAMASRDGLYSICTGNPEAPRWLGKLFISSMKPRQQADADDQKLRSSSGALIIASETEDKSAWVRAGQVYQRMALKMTALDIRSAFLNQPIEVADLRPQFQSAAGLGHAIPQLLMRFGHAEAMPRSLRRPIEQVLV